MERPIIVRDHSKVDSSAPRDSVVAGSIKGDASVLSDGCVSSGGGGGFALGPLRTQLRMELPASLDRVRLFSTRALAADSRIMALAADFAVGVCEGGHGEMAHRLVLAVAALVLHELAGGFVEGGRSWLKGPHLDERLELGRERHSKSEQRALFWCKVDLSTGNTVVKGAEMREVVLSSVKVGMTEAEKLAHEHEELSISRWLVELFKMSHHFECVVEVLLV
jgi:hypothetical protein